ncbi:Sentrin-specific protease 2 [Orobanche gracilis]
MTLKKANRLDIEVAAKESNEIEKKRADARKRADADARQARARKRAELPQPIPNRELEKFEKEKERRKPLIMRMRRRSRRVLLIMGMRRRSRRVNLVAPRREGEICHHRQPPAPREFNTDPSTTSEKEERAVKKGNEREKQTGKSGSPHSEEKSVPTGIPQPHEKAPQKGTERVTEWTDGLDRTRDFLAGKASHDPNPFIQLSAVGVLCYVLRGVPTLHSPCPVSILKKEDAQFLATLGCNGVEISISDIFDNLKSLMHELHLNVKLTKCSTLLYPSAAERSSSIIGQTVEELDGIRKAKRQLPADSLIDQVQMFDPMNICSDTTITEFEDWYTDPDSTNSKIKVQLIHEEVIEHSFFEAFMPGVWRGDAYGLFGGIVEDESPRESGTVSSASDWTFIDLATFYKLQVENMDNSSEHLRNCVCGWYPKKSGKSWKGLAHVYGFGHVLGNHWLAYDIDFKARAVVVYDSLLKCNMWDIYKPTLEKMCRSLAWLCKEEDGLLGESPVWELRQYDGRLPQQTNDKDCGIMVIKYLEYLTSGRPFPPSDVEESLANRFRSSYAAQFFSRRIG